MSVLTTTDTSRDMPDSERRRKIVYTYTMLSTYKNCGHQMFRRYVKKDIPYKETPEMKWGKDVHTAFEHRVGSGKPLPTAMQQWEQFAAPYDGRIAITDGNLISLLISGTDTHALTAGSYFYDLDLINGGTVLRLLEGRFDVTAAVNAVLNQ